MIKKEDQMPRNRAVFGKLFLYGVLFFVGISFFCIFSSSPLFTQTKLTAIRGPLNPEFLKYLQAKAAGKAAYVTPDGHGLGYIPSPHQASSVRPERRAVYALPPASYDLRALGRVTPVRNQGGCGSCWAFATYGSEESILLPAETADFSELDLIRNSGYSLGECAGGNIFMSMGYLGRWSGPINETDAPYPYADAPNGISGGPTIRKHVQNAIFLPPRTSSTDNTIIKEAVMNYGGVYVTTQWSYSAENSNYHSYYNDGTYSIDGGHAICIVGWKDDFPASQFNKPAPGNGAFIVKNSWGTGWGESGYFYASYYDAYFGKEDFSAAILSEPTDNYGTLYQYDPLGWVQSWGYGGTTAWGANIFAAASNGKLSAASFYAGSGNFSYELSIYTGVTAGAPRTGTLQSSTSGTKDYAGYYTINLPNAVPVSEGDKFSVVVKFVTPGYVYPVPTEDYSSGYSDGATSSPGQSFMSPDGTTWDDVSADTTYRTNICIKAFANAGSSSTLTVTSPASGDSWYKNDTKTIAWTKTGAQTANVKIQLMRGTTNVLTIAAGTPNDGGYAWKIPNSISPQNDYFIRIATTDGRVIGDSGLYSILAPVLTLTSPGAGDSWYKGDTKTISWTSLGTKAAKVNIQLMRGTTLILTIASGALNSGGYNWKIPNSLVSRANYFLRIKTTDGLATGSSPLFSILAPSISVTAPNSTSVWTRGSSHTITWTQAGPQNPYVKIILWRNSTKIRDIILKTDNNGTYDWVVPLNLNIGTGFFIRVRTIDSLVIGDSAKFSVN
jgi:C1A family cysteine protease